MEMEEFNCIGEYRNVIDQKDCDILISLFEQIDQRGGTHPGVVKNPNSKADDILNTNAKDSQDLIIFRGKRRERVAYTSDEQHQVILRFIHRVYGCVNKYFYRIDKIMQSPVWLMAAKTAFYPGDFVMKRYLAPSQGYHAWHADSGPGQLNAERVLVALLYLNSVEEGGETLFSHQNFTSKPEAGKLVIFPAGFTHVHKGQPPISNDKYIINGWIVEGDHWLPSEPDIP